MGQVPLSGIKPELDFSEKQTICLAGHTRACCRARWPLSQASYDHGWDLNHFLQFTICLFQMPAYLMLNVFNCDVSTVTISALQMERLRLREVNDLPKVGLALCLTLLY